MTALLYVRTVQKKLNQPIEEIEHACGAPPDSAWMGFRCAAAGPAHRLCDLRRTPVDCDRLPRQMRMDQAEAYHHKSADHERRDYDEDRCFKPRHYPVVAHGAPSILHG